MSVTVSSTPVDGADSQKGKAGATTARSLSAVDANEETVTEEDIAQFLKDVKELNNKASTDVNYHSHVNSINDGQTKARPGESSAEAVEAKLDITIPIVIGAASAGLLIVLAMVVVSIFVCCKGDRRKKDMSLNKDLNRWDPQLLRPTKANIEAFIFGTPIPSVAEMIKQ